MINSHYTLPLALLSTGLLGGLLITAHFASDIHAGGSYPYDQYEAEQDLIKSYLDDQAVLKNRISVLRDELNRIQENSQSSQSLPNLEVLQNLKRELGLTDISGNGVLVEINDSTRVARNDETLTSEMLVHAADLRDIINVLRVANADGISINGQRVVLSTVITGVGNNILVNNTNMLPPFTIAAVGQPEVLLSLLTSEKALPDLYRRAQDVGLQFQIRPSSYIHIPFYTGSFRTEFMTVVE